MNSQINVLYPAPARSGNAAVAAQSLTVSTAAVSFGTTYDPNSVPIVTLDIQGGVNVRARFDGTDPTSTVGHLLYSGMAYTWSAAMFNAAKFIRDTSAASNATIFASPLQN